MEAVSSNQWLGEVLMDGVREVFGTVPDNGTRSEMKLGSY